MEEASADKGAPVTASIAAVLSEALAAVQAAASAAALQQLKTDYLGKSGHITRALQALKTLSHDARPAAGAAVHAARRDFEAAWASAMAAMTATDRVAPQRQALPDITLEVGVDMGGLHPLGITRARLEALCVERGFQPAVGPECETVWHNFTALHVPEVHPARSPSDTFYIEGGRRVLRTHTSSVQIRLLEQAPPPIRCIASGAVYRRDPEDLTHTPMFHQLEGLCIDRNVSMADLYAVLRDVLEAFFERPLRFRWRASYFPFTSPSAEIDIHCVLCEAAGCPMCKQTGWLEVLGCGMVHPAVLIHARIPPSVWQGYAFGMGIERLTMLRYGISDIRWLYENDLQFLSRFRGSVPCG